MLQLYKKIFLDSILSHSTTVGKFLLLYYVRNNKDKMQEVALI